MSWSQVQTFKRDPQGRIFVNDEKDFIKPIELPTDAPNRIVTIAANTRVGPFPLTAKHDGPIEIFYIKVVVYNASDVAQADYNIDIQFEHPGKRKILQNRDIPLIAVAGDAGRPYVLPESIYLPEIQSLLVTYNNLDSAQRKVELVLGGIKYYKNSVPKELRRQLMDYVERRERTYTYFMTTDDEVSLDASEGDQSEIMTVPDDTDLEILKMTCEATGAFRASLKDVENDRQITSGAQIHSSLLFGGHIATAMGGGVGGSGGCFPARWATSLLVRRSTQLELLFDDLSGQANTVKPVFAGRKIAYAS